MRDPKSDIETLKSTAFWLPKAGHTAAEYEDAFSVSMDDDFPLRAAVADGATETAFSGAWARRLAEGFVADGWDAESFESSLGRWQQAWRAETARRAGSLPWYAAAKAEEGAFAALLGLVVEAERSWHALAVGDCCLFHLRHAETLHAWPFDAPEAFTHRPTLVPSRPDRPTPPPLTASGAWQPGDAFLLATDALAACLMRADPASLLPITSESFRQRVVEARAAGTLRNDDVTLVVVRCP